MTKGKKVRRAKIRTAGIAIGTALAILLLLLFCALVSVKASGGVFRASLTSSFSEQNPQTIEVSDRTFEVFDNDEHAATDYVESDVASDEEENDANIPSLAAGIVNAIVMAGAPAPADADAAEESDIPLGLDYGESYVSASDSTYASIVVDGLVVSFDTPASEFKAKGYALNAKRVPSSVLSALAERGWSARIVDYEIDDTINPVQSILDDVSDIGGICDVIGHVISIEEDCSSSVIVHEIGHAIDSECGWMSYEAEWLEVEGAIRSSNECNEATRQAYEATTFSSMHKTYLCAQILTRGYPHERWAEAWACYWENPWELLRECPDAFYYFADRFGIPELSGVVDGYGVEAVMQRLEDCSTVAEKMMQDPIGDDLGVSDKRTSIRDESEDDIQAMFDSLKRALGISTDLASSTSSTER